MKNIKLKVNGMHCQSCEMLIRDMLEGNKAVVSASADLKKKTVTVLFNDNKISTEELRKMIEDIGYKPE
ncbi:MAG: heavy-metal-associated domain-containing protein [Nanoarchaeota archaeon]|nr:heavy-metal-associated domain-containing protein [Nanoarchaeota archaeon]